MGTEVAELADSTESTESAEPTRRPWEASPRRRNIALALVLLAAAAVFAGWSGWRWAATASSDALHYAQARDAALVSGRAAVAALTSMDHRQVDAGMQRWLEVSTGPLHERLADTGAQTKADVRAGGTVATGEVLGAGITELDEHAGTATMLASVEITLAEQGAPATTKRNRFAAELTRAGDTWKISALNPIPVSG